MTAVTQVGLGPIGQAIAARASRAGFDLVGAVDTDPALTGRDLGELLGGAPSGVRIRPDLAEALDDRRPDLILHATGSFLPDVAPQLQACLERGIDVVSTCEELSYPFRRHPVLSRELDGVAGQAGAVLLGTGINPGFVLDKLVLTLMGACDTVDKVHALRVVDAATRREPFQRKIGAGLTSDEFGTRVSSGKLGHVGLAESAYMLAEVMGIGPGDVLQEEIRPIMADRLIKTPCLEVESGQVAGVHQTATIADAGGATRIHAELQMFVGAPNPRDAVAIEGKPPLQMVIGSGVPGDEGTVTVVLHCAGLVRTLEPGLRTMLDVPLRPVTSGGR